LVEETFGSYYDLKKELPEAYPVFEDVLKKVLFDHLDTGKNDPLVRRIFSFLEEMAKSTDRNVTDLLGIAILEPLVFNRERVRRSWKYMEEMTKALARENARSGGWEENLPPGEARTNGH
jgi:DNA-binding ferritin-like protein (Dps family)